MTEHSARKAPTLRDALVGCASLVVADGLLIAQAFALLRLEVPRAVLLTLFPLLILVALAVPTIFLLRYLKRRGIPLGFDRLGAKGWHLLWEFPVAVLFAGAGAALIGPLLGLEPAGETASNDGSNLGVVLTLIAYLVVGPFLEEIVFRRLVMGYLDTVAPAAVSVIGSAILFGLAHIAPPAMLYTGLMGIALALSTRWHKSLWAGLILHFCNNLLVQVVVVGAI